MNIIKLNAINSTNDYLKALIVAQKLENFTAVVAEHQTKGKGQMGAVWSVEPGKNLTFSVLVKDAVPEINTIFNLNVAVALSVAKTLEYFNIPNVKVKWPNDILTGNKKIAGILIENNIGSNGGIHSVVGIGLNVNQSNFNGLPKATSMAVEVGEEFDKEQVLHKILEYLKAYVMAMQSNTTELLWDEYHLKLYKKNIPMTFEKDNSKFMGIIKGVSRTGQLQVQLEDDSVVEYAVKEVQLLY